MLVYVVIFFFKRRTVYEVYMGDLSCDLCSSDVGTVGCSFPEQKLGGRLDVGDSSSEVPGATAGKVGGSNPETTLEGRQEVGGSYAGRAREEWRAVWWPYHYNTLDGRKDGGRSEDYISGTGPICGVEPDTQ